MKRLLFCTILLCHLCGCVFAGTPDAGKTTELAKQVKTLNQQLDRYQEAMAGMKQFAIAAGAEPNAFESLNDADRIIDDVQKQTLIAAESADKQFYEILIEAFRKANKESGNKYSGIIDLALLLLSAGLGIYLKVKAGQANQALETAAAYQLKYQAHKQGVEEIKTTLSASDKPEVRQIAAELYKAIGNARSALGVQTVK